MNLLHLPTNIYFYINLKAIFQLRYPGDAAFEVDGLDKDDVDVLSALYGIVCLLFVIKLTKFLTEFKLYSVFVFVIMNASIEV